MKRLSSWVIASILLLYLSSNAFALSVLGTGAQYAGYGYGGSQWGSMTTALDAATGNNFVTASTFGDLAEMLTYDAIWLDIRDTSSLLGAGEVANISAFLATGRRAVLIGENSSWTAWNQQIVGFGGGTYTDQTRYGTTTSVVSNELTIGASTVQLPAAGAANTGGTSLYDVNFATLWGDNLLTVLDVNVFSDSYWGAADNGAFATNVANWVADSSPVAPVPEPSTLLLLGGGLAGLVWYGRKRKQA